jgi:outer membrane protein assembly factor BamB
MRTAQGRVIAATGCLLLLCIGSAFGQDWPQWRGPNRDGKVTGYLLPAAPPTGVTEVWNAPVGLGCATPALVGDRLYAFTREGDNEVTTCLNTADGSVVWADKCAAAVVTGAAASFPGPRSSPTVADGKVVTVGVAGVVSCLDAATGAVAWRKDPFPNVVPMFFTSSSPLIADGLVVAFLGGQGNGALMAFDLASGDVKWQWNGEAAEYGSPVVATLGGVRQVVTLGEKSLVGVDLADGALLWQVPFPLARRSYNSATPIIDGDKVIYAGSGRGTHAVRIEKPGDAFTATEVWANAAVAPQFATPVLENGLLFGMTDGGSLYCLDAATGMTKWLVDIPVGQGGFCSLVSLGEVIVALPSTGETIAFAATGDAYTELTRLKVSDTPTYAHPIITSTQVYIKDEPGVRLLTLN